MKYVYYIFKTLHYVLDLPSFAGYNLFAKNILVHKNVGCLKQI